MIGLFHFAASRSVSSFERAIQGTGLSRPLAIAR